MPAHCPALSFTEKMKSDSESKKTFDGAPHLINRRYLQCSYGEGSSPVFLPALPAKTTPLEFIESKALAQTGTAAFFQRLLKLRLAALASGPRLIPEV